jgi:hypothetical protein
MKGERALFGVLLALHLVPLALVPAFPSQDGPSHVEAAFNLRHYADPEFPLIREYYVRNPTPEPNLLGHLLLMGLLEITHPVLAEKILIAAFVLLFPLSVRYALRAVAIEAAPLAVLAFPFVYSWPLHMGFFNFCWGLPLFFFLIGYWIRHRQALGLRQGIDIAALSLVLWAAHVVPLVLALAVIAAWGAVERRGALRTLVALTPVLTMTTLFVWRKQPVPSDRPPFLDLLRGLVRLESLVSFRDTELVISTAMAVLFTAGLVAGLYALAREGRRRPADALLLAATLFVLVYFLAPRRMAGGAYLNERLALFPFLALLLWLGARPLAGGRALVGAGALLALASLSLHAVTYLQLREPMAEYLSAGDALEPEHTLLPLSFAPEGWGMSRLGPRTKVFLHTASYLAAERGVLNLANYEGNYVHFPLIFRPELNPFVHLADGQGLEGDPPCADLDAYEKATGRTIDVVLLWGLRAHQETGEPCTERLLAQLARDYRPIFTSEPRRMVRLFARKAS